MVLLLLFDDPDLDLRGHLGVQPDGNGVYPQGLDRLLEHNFSLVDLVSFLLQGPGYLHGRHRAEELVVLTGLFADGDDPARRENPSTDSTSIRPLR